MATRQHSTHGHRSRTPSLPTTRSQYPFYKHAGAPQWKSCIRHNLSTKKKFFVHNMAGPGRTTWSVCAGANPSTLLKHLKVHVLYKPKPDGGFVSDVPADASSQPVASDGPSTPGTPFTSDVTPMSSPPGTTHPTPASDGGAASGAGSARQSNARVRKKLRVATVVSAALPATATAAAAAAATAAAKAASATQSHKGLVSLLRAIDAPRANTPHCFAAPQAAALS